MSTVTTRRAILTATTRGASEDDPQIVTDVIASTDAVDSYNDVVDQSSWDLARYLANPVILFGHDYRTPPVGRATDVGVVDGQLKASITWDTAPENDLGRLVAGQFERGVLSAVSVGFRSHTQVRRDQLPEDHPYRGDSGFLLQDNELLEISAVVVPANAEAVAQRGVSADVEQLVSAYLASPEGRLHIESVIRELHEVEGDWLDSDTIDDDWLD